MAEVSTIGLDIAKQVFHAHGADATGATVFSRRITRANLIPFFASQPKCTVAMEACAGAHHWGRERPSRDRHRWILDRCKIRIDRAVGRGESSAAMKRRNLYDAWRGHSISRGIAKFRQREWEFKRRR